ncbi:MAG TPA: PEP-CTERM sorting domain-containing protein [Candidatus Limnocylindria bacterium]|nr:PEP-CTERM sorting domain-containing protein [Candidatus Limnocylindria bacterium]
MKSAIFLGAMLLGVSAMADPAEVLFNNSKVGQPVYWMDGVTKLSNANFVSRMYFSTDGSSFTPLGGTFAFNTVAAKAGYWSGNTKRLEFPDSVVQGQTVTLKAVVWDSTRYASWESGEAAGWLGSGFGDLWSPHGDSKPFSYTAPIGSNPDHPELYYITGFQSFALTTAPEPSVVALGGLGVIGFIWARAKRIV